jgi:hypothetical protein
MVVQWVVVMVVVMVVFLFLAYNLYIMHHRFTVDADTVVLTVQ